MAIIPTFFLSSTGQENVFYDILEPKNTFQGYKNQSLKSRKIDIFKKSKSWHFSKGVNPWFWFKNGHFSNIFFLGNIGQENVFYDIIEPKNTFLDYKNIKFKKSKNRHFFKGVKPWFWSKNGHYSHFFCIGSICQKNVFYDILKPKNTFLGYKNEKFKKSKNWHFSKGLTHGFCPKMVIFPTLFLRQYRPGKSLLRYSRTKKHLSRP